MIEEFIFRMLHHVRSQPKTANKNVILLMDNAVVHKHHSVLETCKKLKVNLLLNAEYSPWINPVEQLFGFLKGQMKTRVPKDK